MLASVALASGALLSPKLALLRPLTAATMTSLVLRMSEEQEDQEEQDEEQQIRQSINVSFDTVSWAFLPIILLLGLSLAVASGRGADGAPIRIGAKRGADPLSFSAPPRATLEGPAGRALAATTSSAPSTDAALHGALLLSLVGMAPDDVLRDLQDEPSVRALSLPQAEQAKQRAMEELEDDRLERCRSAAAFEFDQCFFFGPSGTTAARRPMEGAGTLYLSCTRCVSLVPHVHSTCMLHVHMHARAHAHAHVIRYVAGSLRLTPSARKTEQLASFPLPPEDGPRKVPTW